MKYLHSYGILHRDLKSDSILMDENLFPKIADFGLSKFSNSEYQSLNINSEIGLKGIPIYFAPEVFISQEHTKASDVYSFGLIVYQIMCCVPQIEEFSFYFQLIQKIIYENYRPPFINDITEVYKKLVEMCWDKQPENRPYFEQIVNELKENEDFLTEFVDFLDYVDFVENYEATFNYKRAIHFDDFIKKRRKSTLKKLTIREPPKLLDFMASYLLKIFSCFPTYFRSFKFIYIRFKWK